MITLKNAIHTFCLLLSSTLAAQNANYAVSRISAENLKMANSVVRNSELQITIDDMDEAEINITYTVTILNEEDDSENTCYQWENKFEKIKSFEGKLFNASGELIRESTKKDIETFGDFSTDGFADGITKRLKMYDVQYPYTVEFSVRKQLKGFFMLPRFTVQKAGQSVENGRFKLSAPNDYPFKWKGINTTVNPGKNVDGKTTTWEWRFNNIRAVPAEKYTERHISVLSQVYITPGLVEIDGNKGSFENWTQMGRFFYELNKDRDNLSPEMQQKVLGMIKGATSNRAKIDTLYRYLQNTYRYVSIQLGIGGWQTFDAEFVENKQYGDCKALSNYMKAMLKTAGINAYMALIDADDEGGRSLYDDAPAPFFNHAILYVPDENLWLECTSKNNPCGYLSSSTADRPALVLTPEGGKKINTPNPGAAGNTKVTHTDIILKEDGKASVNSRFTATGEQQEYYRSLGANTKQDEMEKAFIRLQEIPMGKLNVLQINSSKTNPEATIHFEGVMDGYFTRSGKRIFVPLNKIHPFRRSLVADNERYHDICLTSAYTLTDTINIVLPAGYKSENVPGPKKIDSEFGHYEITVQQNADQIVVIRQVIMVPVSAPAIRYQEIRKVYLDMAKADGMQVVLVKTE